MSNAVDVHNILSVGSLSECNVATASPWLYLVACAEANAFLVTTHYQEIYSEQYNHADL
jgi:hypothetical protein